MRYYMFNKPRGCITARCDPRCKTVMDYFPEEEKAGLFPVGRLDKDTEGFLIFTDDGKFCFHINEPTHHVEKTYFFYARGTLDEKKLKALESGVPLTQDGSVISAPAKVRRLPDSTYREISHLLDEDTAKLTHTRRGDIPVVSAEITVTEGKKHQVKRMAKAVGLHIVYLERIAIASIPLDKTLKRGEFRQLTPSELEILNG